MRRPSPATKAASGAVSSKALPSRRASARGNSKVGHLSFRASASSVPTKVSDTRSDARADDAASALCCSALEVSLKEPPCSWPRCSRCPTQARVCGASAPGQSALKVPDRHRPDLAFEPRCQRAAHARHVAFRRDLGPTGTQPELAEHNATALRGQKAVRTPIVDRQAVVCRQLGADPTALAT